MSSAATTQSSLCIRHPTRPAVHARDPRFCNLIDGTIVEPRVGIRIRKYDGSGAWQESGAESKPRMGSYGTASGKWQLDVRQGSQGKKRCATKTLARLHIANATCAVCSCVNHPSQCCPVYECIELKVFCSVNTSDVTNELHELGNQDVDSECEDQLFTSDYTEKRFVERCATRLVFYSSSRVYVFVALISTALSSNIVYGTDASPQSNASSATVLKPRVLFSILYSVQNWRNCPTPRCVGNHPSVERARWHVVSSGAKVGCWTPS